ncbi:MAG: hydrolase [Phycisphaerales bacterium]|nr:hydrolase [Phycisphaerales bacterium]
MAHQLIEKQVVYEGKRIRLEVHHLDHDRTGKRLKKEIVVHPGAVVILGFLPDGRLLLIRNRRYSVDETLIELPAGGLEKGEMPMNAAGRELLEETGYLAGRIKPLPGFYASPGVLTEKMHLFAAYDLTHQGQALEPDEEIEVLPTRLPDAIEMIRDGQIKDAKTIAGILMYDRFFGGPVPVPGTRG